MIVTICGSARFSRWIQAWHRALTLSGHLVFDKGMPPIEDTKDWMTPEQKAIVAQAMREKIMLSSALVCLNPFAYMGEDTLGFRAFAEEHKTPVYTLESWGKGCGIGPNHTQIMQYAARNVFSLPEGYGSPVDTAMDWHDPFDLLPPAGPFRSRLVKMVEAPMQSMIGSLQVLQAQGIVKRELPGDR